MKLSITKRVEGGSRHLVLLFVGWGMSPRPLGRVEMPGYDIGIVWDYRDMTAPWVDELSSYKEIVIVAWSFGVNAAARFLASNPGMHTTALVAVNGTRFTADDNKGIPRNIFDATLRGLSEKSAKKFQMRMCGGASSYKDFAPNAPERDVEDLREELQSFANVEAPRLLWDKAFVSDGDLIIPPENQLRAWQNEAVEVITMEGAHLPDFNSILRRCLTDKSYVEKRFRKAVTTYDDNTPVQHEVAVRLLNFVTELAEKQLERVLEIGCGTGQFTKMLLDRLKPRNLYLWDLYLSPDVKELKGKSGDTALHFKECDAETEVMNVTDGEYNLIVSASTVQWFNSLRSFLVHAAGLLHQGGMFVLSTYGPDTMSEVHRAIGTTSRFLSMDMIRKVIPDSFETVMLSEERFVIEFDEPIDVLRHLSRSGVNCVSQTEACSGQRFLKNYPLDTEGKACLTYNPIYLILRKL